MQVCYKKLKKKLLSLSMELNLTKQGIWGSPTNQLLKKVSLELSIKNYEHLYQFCRSNIEAPRAYEELSEQFMA